MTHVNDLMHGILSTIRTLAIHLTPPRSIAILLATAISLVVLPSYAQSFAPTVNVSNTRSDAANFTHQMAVSAPYVYVAWQDKSQMFSRSTNDGVSFSAASALALGLIRAAGSNVYAAGDARPSPKAASQIYFRRSVDNGVSFSSQMQISAASGTNGAFLEEFVVSGDNIYLLWRQNVGTVWRLYFARSTNSGMSFGPGMGLSDSATDPTMTATTADGFAVVEVAWTEKVSGVNQVMHRRSIDGGVSFPGAQQISNGSGQGSARPTLASVGGNVYAVWAEYGTCVNFSCNPGEAAVHIVFARCDMSGNFFPPMDLSSGAISDTRGIADHPQQQVVASGSDVHVIWNANPVSAGNYDIFYRGSNDAGNTFGAISNISNPNNDNSYQYGALYSPEGTIAANGQNVYISWNGGSSTAREIYMAHSADRGLSFPNPVINVSSTIAGDSEEPQLFAATPTDIRVIWLDHTPGNWDVFYRRGTP